MKQRDAVFCFAVIALMPIPAFAQSSMPERLPATAKRLDTSEIKALMGSGVTFTFVGAGGKATGTSIWNLFAGAAYGTFVWANRINGTWNARWSVEDDLSCLESSPGKKVCQQIYGYEDGFFEVDADGSIHTHTVPRTAAPLAQPLTADEAAALFPAMLDWAQNIHRRVTSASEAGGIISLEVLDADDNAATVKIDAATGLILGPN